MKQKYLLVSMAILISTFQNCGQVAFENNRAISSLGNVEEPVTGSGTGGDTGSTVGSTTGSTTGGTDTGLGVDAGTTTGGMDTGTTVGSDTGTSTGMDTGTGIDTGSTSGMTTGTGSTTGTTGFTEIGELCDQPGSVTTSFPINWDSNMNVAGNNVCQWATNPNGGLVLQDQFVMARNEEARSFELPPGAVLCEMSVSSPTQLFEYDDMFLLTLNGIVLSSATSWFHGFPNWEGMQAYNWTNLAGTAWPADYQSHNYNYCVGVTEGLSTCSIPLTETNGNFAMNIGNTLIQKIGTRATGSTHEFKLIVTGDNDPTKDCRHRALGVTVNIRYAIPAAP